HIPCKLGFVARTQVDKPNSQKGRAVKISRTAPRRSSFSRYPRVADNFKRDGFRLLYNSTSPCYEPPMPDLSEVISFNWKAHPSGNLTTRLCKMPLASKKKKNKT